MRRRVAMKCKLNNCGKETGKPCPPSLVPLSQHDPRIILSAFQELMKEEDVEGLDSFVCTDCEGEWMEWLVGTGRMDFSI